MRKIAFSTTMSILGFLASGCAELGPQVQNENWDTSKAGAIVYQSSMRGAYSVPVVASGRTSVAICAEPAPDTAVDGAIKLASTFKGNVGTATDMDVSANADVTSSVVELAGRSQLVLLAREMFYRDCEYSLNHPGLAQSANAGSSDFVLYKQSIQAVVELAKALQEAAKADQKASDADKAKTDAKIINNAVDKHVGAADRLLQDYMASVAAANKAKADADKANAIGDAATKLKDVDPNTADKLLQQLLQSDNQH